MADISKLAELRKLLMGIEHSLGLQDLSSVERDIYYAASDISEDQEDFKTIGLLEHALVAGVSRPTFFRALKSLVHKGYLSPSDVSSRGRYVVNAPHQEE